MNRRIQKLAIAASLRSLRAVRPVLLSSPSRVNAVLTSALPVEAVLWRLGEWRLAAAFDGARKEVPGYREFLEGHGKPRIRWEGWDPDFSEVPVTDKASYVKPWPVEERCRFGKLPDRGVTIDESSGTSGMPSNWVRGAEERADMRQLLNTSGRILLGEEPIFVINAFALGPWATGMTVSMSLADLAIVKSTGPEIPKIVNTLNLFGPKYRYMICGYPPFLKALVDSKEVDWKQFNCIAFVGGEGMSEGLRSHLLGAFQRVYSSFGASDLEINVAAENDFSIAFRQLLAERPELRTALDLPDHGSLPMVFQYNPLDYYIETNDAGELVISVVRRETLSPKIRYNIHDLGAVRRYRDIEVALATIGKKPTDLAKRHFHLPFVFHYGRSDMTIAFYGANVAPADIDEVSFRIPELAGKVASHRMLIGEDGANKTLTIAFEMKAGQSFSGDREELRWEVLRTLSAVNQDYRGAAAYIPEGNEPTVELFDHGTGPFEGYDIRLKHQYIQARAS